MKGIHGNDHQRRRCLVLLWHADRAGAQPHLAQREQGRFHRHHRALRRRQVYACRLPVGCRAPPLHRHVLWGRHGRRPRHLRSLAHRRVANRRQCAAGYRHADGRLGRRGRDALWPRELWRSPRPDRAARERNARDRRHQRPARPRDRHPLGRTEAKGSHRRHPRHASARLGSRRAHRGTRPRQLHVGFRDAA